MTSTLLATAAVAAAVLAGTAPAQAAAKAVPSCARGGATLEQRDGGVRVLRMKAKKRSSLETRHEYVLACWAKTGKRFRISEEVDFGLDSIASTQVEIVGGRYVGVVETNEGGASLFVGARVYDGRTGRKLHTTRVCSGVDAGDFNGADDVAFLDGGGLAFACNQLLLYRKGSTKTPEVLEPPGTDVRQLAVSHYSNGFGQRLFWTVGDGGVGEVTKSLAL
jgi:hypothetical protein